MDSRENTAPVSVPPLACTGIAQALACFESFGPENAPRPALGSKTRETLDQRAKSEKNQTLLIAGAGLPGRDGTGSGKHTQTGVEICGTRVASAVSFYKSFHISIL